MAYQSSPQHIDFISNLPPEIILEILVSVRIKDVLSCMCVCREWYVRLRHLQPYWNIALNRLGLPPHMRTNVTIQQQSTLMMNTDSKESVDWYILAVQAWRGREYIASSAPEVVYISAQYRQYFQCNYCRHGTLVATLYQDFIPLATFVYKIQPGSKRLVTKNRFTPVLDSPQGRVCWVSVYCDYLLMATACGRWQGYSLTTNAKLLDWSGPELYDQDVVTCCCQYCFLVVLVKPVSQRRYLGIRESYWEIQVITLGRGYSTPTVYNYNITTSYNIPPSMVNYGCTHSGLISSSSVPGGSSTNVFCSSHLLLLQWANCVTIYGIDERLHISNTPVKILSDNDATTAAMYSTNSLTLMREVVQTMQYCNTSFTVSSDSTLIGFIFSDKLNVWSLRDEFQHESTINLRPHRGSDNTEHFNSQVHLLAVGHLYSLIGLGSIDGQLKVICTYTGKCIFSTHGFSGVSTKEGLQVVGTPPPYFSYLGVVDEHWLSNVDTWPPSTIPVILYWMKKEQGVFGIIFKHGIQNKVTSPEELTEVGTRSSEQAVNISYGIQSRIHNLYRKFF